MVTRVYKCRLCGREFDIRCPITDPANPLPCEVEGCEGRKVVKIQPVVVIFKGSGFTRAGTTQDGNVVGGGDVFSPAYHTGDGETVGPAKIDRATGKPTPVSMEEFNEDLTKQRG